MIHSVYAGKLAQRCTAFLIGTEHWYNQCSVGPMARITTNNVQNHDISMRLLCTQQFTNFSRDLVI